MPQLDVTTFASQIFWVAIGFVLVYLFMAFFAAPKLSSILDERKSLVKGMVADARRLQAEAISLKERADKVHKDALAQFHEKQSTMIKEFESSCEAEKKRLYDEFSLKVSSEREQLLSASEQVYKEIESDIDELLDLSKKALCGRRKS